MIDEKKLLENLIPLLNEHGDMYFAGRIIGMIDSQPKIGEWIPCSERLPEKDGKYLVTYCDDLVENYVITRNYYNGRFEPMPYSEEHTGRKSLAWQPLPEPYEP